MLEHVVLDSLKYTVVVSSGMDFPGYDLWVVGHGYGIVHVSLLMVWKITRKFLVLFELMDYTSKGG